MKYLQCVFALLLVGSGCNKTKPAETTGVGNASADRVVEDKLPDQSDSTSVADSGPKASLEEVIFFAFDSSDLDDAARQALNGNADWLREDESRTLLIEGHTDETGTVQYNLGLGDRRARAAKNYLVRLGISEQRVRVITYGEEKPASNEDSKNRRSMFVATRK